MVCYFGEIELLISYDGENEIELATESIWICELMIYLSLLTF